MQPATPAADAPRAGTALGGLEHSYAEAVPALSVPFRAEPAPAPRLLVLNDALAADLGLDPAALRADPALLTGQLPADHPTYAQAYAGHQFGSYQPQLGDGRAVLLGELGTPGGGRVDLHLKGSGRTRFSRGGDGKAVIGPMLREYVIGEAMHALGIPTTRALSVVATGEPVLRRSPEPGAVLCRVAASHLRVGTFQYAASTGDRELLQALADYAIARHYPSAAESAQPYLALLRAVVLAQADLVARWMLVGFVHGVMNTDNMTISGQTIDYGPCAFLDRFAMDTVFSSIDLGGRYAYGNQPSVALWNLARFAETLIPLLVGPADPTDPADEAAHRTGADAAVEAVTEVLGDFGPRYQATAAAGMAAKLGLPAPDDALAEDLLALLAAQRVDFTSFFRALAGGMARELFAEPTAYDAWAVRREAALPTDPDARAAIAAAMNRVNPLYIPRNHRVEEALAAATGGDLAPVRRLVAAVSQPYVERADLADLAGPAPDDAGPYVTYCGT
ncbi:MAG: YdiU family protein [Austwickia sp.]|nr:MAG: YdiU family protein [Austwickia sp.]